MQALLQKAGPGFLGSDIINSDLDVQSCFKDFVANMVLSVGEMEMMGCVEGAKNN